MHTLINVDRAETDRQTISPCSTVYNGEGAALQLNLTDLDPSFLSWHVQNVICCTNTLLFGLKFRNR